jgi:hypothetical protein
MDVDVNQARTGDEAAGVDFLRALFVGGTESEATIRPSLMKRSPTWRRAWRRGR